MLWLIPGLSCAAVLTADVVTKALATQQLAGGRVAELPLGVRLAYGENSGIAFGLLAGSSGLILGIALIVILALVVVLLRSRAWLTAVPIGVLLGGAFANLVDRVGDGAVTDFVDLGPWPAFNVADVAITTGVALFVLAFARHPAPSPFDADPSRTLANEARDA